MLTQLISYDPWRDLRAVQHEMDHLLTEFFPGLVRRGPASASPGFNVYDAGDAYVITAAVPGLTHDELSIEATADSVTVSGERKPTAPEGYEARRRERPTIKFNRTVSFERRIDTEAVEASLKDGILTIKLAKLAKDRPRQIAIQAA